MVTLLETMLAEPCQKFSEHAVKRGYTCLSPDSGLVRTSELGTAFQYCDPCRLRAAIAELSLPGQWSSDWILRDATEEQNRLLDSVTDTLIEFEHQVHLPMHKRMAYGWWALRLANQILPSLPQDPQPWRWGRQRFEDADPAGQDFDFSPEWDPRPGYEQDRSKYA